ncbi:Hydrolase, peptidase M42 family [Desulfamplus magnetovallimortis]|uniref:Hydrolase, peptidase M42 family n=1 Tax=Desulfamplus magnetovallimortis TaxID=1246637 RepID=A0A1W1HJI8_9BACT|nr:osmoprotectant NAGGN system M42 family peptidase [Desulfamplus magnetovallimortis]SLM32606.1 Hydrolase, peptidase M42 family [Desulfamplus magnetovallimortis]
MPNIIIKTIKVRKHLDMNESYLKEKLLSLLQIPSPSGYTDQIVHHVCRELESLDISYNVTRRGAIRATIPGKSSTLDRAVCVHLDTLGAMISRLKSNGRLAIMPIGTWSSRFAEGARVTIFTQEKKYRGTILPLKASGHVYNDEIDTQPVSWKQVEVRVDAHCYNKSDLERCGFEIGDYIAIDPCPEIDVTGYINSRHLDNKAGAAVLLCVARKIIETNIKPPVDCHLLFTINEELGTGANAVLYNDITEMVVIDSAMTAPNQNSTEQDTTLVMMDQAGPFDYHLNKKLAKLCKENNIGFKKDIFEFYRSDSASAIEAGSDIRTALVGFGVDASHGYERTHISSLVNTGKLILTYIESEPTFKRDEKQMGTIKGFPHQPTRAPINIET